MPRERRTSRDWRFIRERKTGGKFRPPANWWHVFPTRHEILSDTVEWEKAKMMAQIGILNATGHRDEAEELAQEARVRFSKPPQRTPREP